MILIYDKRFSILLFFFALIFISGCGEDKKENEGKIPVPDKSTYEVEYTDNTVVIEEDVMESFISADKKSGDYTFTSDADDLLDLKPGKIVFFYGHSVRRIKSVAEKGDDIIVYTEYVTLNEAIKNGTIGWENKIDWSSDQPEVRGASLLIGDEVFAAQETSEFKIHYEGKIQGWDISLDLVPKEMKCR